MKKLWKIALIAVIAIVASCGTYTKQPVASHIVAVTMEGDTILVAIDKIRPNMYHSYYPVYSSYNYYRPYYYGQQEYQFRYSDNRGSRGSSGGSKSGGGNVKINPKPINQTPDIVVRPSGETLLKKK
jgi:uncharacterized membrane protein YgcG